MSTFNAEWTVEPHGALEEVADGIWTVAGTITMPLGKFPRRMTVIVLANGGLAIWSPIALDETEMNRLDALGPIEFLVVPNAGHRLDLKAWKTRYPHAKIVAPPGAANDVAEAAPVDETTNVLGDPDVSFELVTGTKSDEFAVTVTRADGATLILNDILSSIREPHGIGANIMARLFGFGIDHPRTSRMVRLMYIADAGAVASQFRRWADIPDLRRVIVSHVDIIDIAPALALQNAASELHA